MATYQLLLRKNKAKKDGTFPVIFKVYQGNKSKIITLPFSCNKNEWDITNKRLRKKHPKYKEINEGLNKLIIRLQNAIDELEVKEIDYDLNDIIKEFKQVSKAKRVKDITVSQFLLNRIEELNAEKRYGSARTTKDTYNSLFRFTDKSIKFKDVTGAFLDGYEHFLRKTGGSDGGIGVRMRDIRTAFNRAIKHGYAKELDYPFNKAYKISKLKSSSQKIAINKEEFIRFKSFNIEESSNLLRTYNMFLFSYYAGGMNFKDMTFLKWENVSDGRLMYKRNKTKGNFNLSLRKEAIEILDYFKNNEYTENDVYIFPIINKNDLTDKQVDGRYRRCLREFNKELKNIAKSVGIKKSLTSYVARHSFATHLKLNNVQENIISQLMGHSSESVTKAYLKDFGSDVLDEAMNKLN